MKDYLEFRTVVTDTVEAFFNEQGPLYAPRKVYWPGIPDDDEPPSDAVWSRLEIRQFTDRVATLAGQYNVKRHRVTGAIYLQIFHPKSRGELLRPAAELAILAQRRFQSNLGHYGITVKQSLIDPVGAKDAYYQHLVTVRYEYDEVY